MNSPPRHPHSSDVVRTFHVPCQLISHPNSRTPPWQLLNNQHAFATKSSATKPSVAEARSPQDPAMELLALFLVLGGVQALKAPWELPLSPLKESEPALRIARMQMSDNPAPVSPLQVTDHVVSLTQGNMNAKSRSAIVAQAIREQARAAAGRLEVRWLKRSYLFSSSWLDSDWNVYRTDQQHCCKKSPAPSSSCP